jgi:type VI secretion system secreted protein VgrG
VVRARDGLLITTEARLNAGRHAKDLHETIGRLTGSREQHENLSQAAQQARSQETGDQDEVTQAIKAQNDAIRGEGATGGFPELSEPHLVLASPAGIESTTAGSTHAASDVHHAITSGAHTSVSAGRSLLVSAKEAVRMFAYKAGMRLVAASQDIEFSALMNNINLLAKIDITQTANKITLTAKEEVVINGGGSYSRWNAAGITHGTKGTWVEHAASHRHTGPLNATVLPLPETTPLREQLHFVVMSHPVDGVPLALQPYELFKDGAKLAEGVTDALGRVLIEHIEGARTYAVRLASGAVYELQVSERFGAQDAEQRRASRGFRAREDASSRTRDYPHNPNAASDHS